MAEVITNDPILLDATGQDILSEMKIHSGYLQMLAEGRRQEIYGSMAQIAAIVRANTVARNQAIFPIGDQIVMPWKDLDDNAHNTDETAYQVAWDIVHHGLVELKDGRTVPGMFLQMHKCSAYGVQFSHQQAFLNCPTGLAAGTYHLTLGSSWGSHAVVGKTYQFTLTSAVPAGGRLSGFEGMPDQAPANWRVKSWANPQNADPIETVTLSEGDDGTNLGTMPYTTPDSESGLNCMQSVAYGNNRWKTSAIRQYLNSEGTSWFASQENYDIRPDQYNKYGFMSGFNADFLAAIKPVKIATALNTVQGFTDTYEETFDTFFLPSLQQINVNPQLANVEGDVFEYWQEALASSSYVGTGGSNIFDAFKIPAINANSAQNVRLRSAHRGNAHSPWSISSSGYVGSTHASYAYRFSPVCVIC